MNHDGAQINKAIRFMHHVGAFLFPAYKVAHVFPPAKKGFCEANQPIYSASQSPAGAPTRHLSVYLKVS